MDHYVSLNSIAYPGQLVRHKPTGRIFRVTKTNVKNYKAEDESGGSWNVPIAACELAPVGTEFNAAPKKELPRLVLGSTVRFTGKGASKFPGTYVLIKHLADNYAQFAKLGGDGDRYVRANLAGLEEVDV